MARHRFDVGIKNNGPEWLGVVIYVSVILVMQWCGDAKVTEEYSTVIVDEEICRLDISVDKTIDMQIAIDD